MKKYILIVEDDKFLGKMLGKMLESHNYEVVLAGNGREGLLKASNSNPNLILLDIMMPKMNGIEVAQKLEELKIKIPIIFLTNMSGVDMINKAIEAVKFNVEYIVKTDVHITQIVSRVKEKLGVK